MQDPAIHKYVTLVGTTLAQQSERPNLDWTFIVLDTDGVNAFASPGGIVHVTRGALGLVEERSGAGRRARPRDRPRRAQAHRQRHQEEQGGEDGQPTRAVEPRDAFLEQLANKAYEMVLENSFDRGDELDADKVGVDAGAEGRLRAGALGDFLTRLDERNKNQAEKNGLFASHPETKERIDKIKQQAAGANGRGARRAALQDATSSTSRAAHVDCRRDRRIRRLAGRRHGSRAESKEEPKKKGFGLGGAEADRRAGEAEHAGVGLGRRPRTRRRPRRQGRQQSDAREGHRVGRRSRRRSKRESL